MDIRQIIASTSRNSRWIREALCRAIRERLTLILEREHGRENACCLVYGAHARIRGGKLVLWLEVDAEVYTTRGFGLHRDYECAKLIECANWRIEIPARGAWTIDFAGVDPSVHARFPRWIGWIMQKLCTELSAELQKLVERVLTERARLLKRRPHRWQSSVDPQNSIEPVHAEKREALAYYALHTARPLMQLPRTPDVRALRQLGERNPVRFAGRLGRLKHPRGAITLAQQAALRRLRHEHLAATTI